MVQEVDISSRLHSWNNLPTKKEHQRVQCTLTSPGMEPVNKSTHRRLQQPAIVNEIKNVNRWHPSVSNYNTMVFTLSEQVECVIYFGWRTSWLGPSSLQIVFIVSIVTTNFHARAFLEKCRNYFLGSTVL